MTGVLEGGNLKTCRTKIKTAIQVIKKGMKVSFCALNSRYRIKKKFFLREVLKDLSLLTFLSITVVTSVSYSVFFYMTAVIKKEKTIKFGSMSLVSEVRGIA